jgi:hypothetical protein
MVSAMDSGVSSRRRLRWARRFLPRALGLRGRIVLLVLIALPPMLLLPGAGTQVTVALPLAPHKNANGAENVRAVA